MQNVRIMYLVEFGLSFERVRVLVAFASGFPVLSAFKFGGMLGWCVKDGCLILGQWRPGV